ncbi:MAG TPA: glycosyltransferase WbuB [Fervidicoccus fontis]|uniref:Glycosyltransferase WbuB n=2 Tax=Fervidicoccus fontis TaxID=683846 RepID=A0A7C2VNA6_9CREN|nr:glycosyltransferase WbuB [Fervidicoccus fontis]
MDEKGKIKKNVLIITPHYPPDGGPSAQLFCLLAEELARRSYSLKIICAVPHYPSGRVPNNYKGIKIFRENINEVNINRVPLPSLNRKNLYCRFFQFIFMQIGFIIASLKERPDILIASNPALQTGLAFIFFKLFKNPICIFSIHDFYPDVGVRLGIFKNKFIIKFVEFLESLCFEKADYIRVLSESFIPLVKRYEVAKEKIVLIYDWVDTEFLKPKPKINSFSVKYHLTDTFNVLYAGNIGFSQGLEIILDTALLLSEKKDIRFIIVGEGPAKERLLETKNEKQLNNVLILPFQPKNLLPEVLSTGDILLVCLRKGMSYTSLPSKTYSILSCGRPIIGCLDEGSDSWNLILKAGAGICIDPENPMMLSNAILKLKNNKDLCKELGRNGREYCIKNHSVKYATEKFEELFNKIK